MSTVKSVHSKIAALVVVVSMFVASFNVAADEPGGWEEPGGWIPSLMESVIPSIHDSTYVPATNVDEKQIDCLAKNIYHEARHESYEGKLAVAQVTMNRTEHGNFPSTVCEVVYQKTKSARTNKLVCQFSWVCDRKIRSGQIRSPSLWDESYAIARRVLTDGLELTRLSSALYYHAVYVNPRWGLQRVARIGQHVFYSEQKAKKKYS